MGNRYLKICKMPGPAATISIDGRMKKKMGSKLPPVVVTTVRLDQGIRDEFVLSGLKPEHFLTKYSVRDAGDFVKRLQEILKASSS